MEQDRNSPGNNALGLGLELLMESDYREGPCNQLGKKKKMPVPPFPTSAKLSTS